MVTEYVYIKIKIWIRAAHYVNIGVQIKELGPLKMTCKINFSDENQIVFENDCMVYIREGVTNRGCRKVFSLELARKLVPRPLDVLRIIACLCFVE